MPRVADASDHNANSSYEKRRSLDRTKLAAEIQNAAAQIDIESLEAAIREGVCEPLEYGRGNLIGNGAGFYQGAATQPFHVAADLVIRRPDVVEGVLSSLSERSAVVITGPSGVGKSAVLWTIPQERRDVLWFRVRRLADKDVANVIRLARAYRAAPESPVGFLVDSAGTSDFTGWARLRAEAAAIPGMLLVATARAEDLMALGGLAECAMVAVRLDERTAEAIHAGLSTRGATDLDHWLEAFESSGGLTLEFTHILTSGRRLRDVIRDQIDQRIRESRHSELEVLALVAAADRWSVELPAEGVASACGLSAFEMREALGRLREEHLVAERDGQIGGVHQLRSTAICEAIHDQPPPSIKETIQKVVPLLPASQLPRFIASLLKDNPGTRATIIESASRETPDMDRVSACLQGLRLADFHELAGEWDVIAEQHGVLTAARPALFLNAIGEFEPYSGLPAEFHDSWKAITTASGRDTRIDLIEAVGQDGIAQILAATGNTEKATRLFAVLERIGSEFAGSFEDALDKLSPLAQVLQEAPLAALAECLASARDADLRIAHALVECIGGERAVIERIRADNPRITQLEITEGAECLVGTARMLHDPKGPRADPNEQAHSLGRTMLWCLPRIAAVDVQDLLLSGRLFGASLLTRENAPATSRLAWNQARMNIARARLTERDTDRLAKALPLLESAAEAALQVGTALVTGRRPSPGLDQKIATLHEHGRNLRPSPDQATAGDAAILETRTLKMADDLSALVLDITGNVIPRLLKGRDGYRALATYISDTVIGRRLNGAISESWRLVGVEGCPPSPEALRSSLEDLLAVVGELARNDADTGKIRRSALAGTEAGALQRAAETCRKAEERRRRTRR